MNGIDPWALIGGLTVTTFLVKAAGPVVLGGRQLPEWFTRVSSNVATPLLAALVVTAVLADGRRLAVGAHTAGALAAGLVVWRGRSIVVGVVAAAVVTAGIRALGTAW